MLFVIKIKNACNCDSGPKTSSCEYNVVYVLLLSG